VKSIQVDGQVFDHLKAHGMGAGQSASDVLRSLLLRTIEIDDELYAYLMSLASAPGETPNNILRRELDIGESPTQPPAIIEFHIPAGTGSNSWNARGTAVMGVVGQTLRIHNDDNVAHRLHTSGAPFPHAANDTTPGTFSDFVLAQPYSLDTMPGIYDHNFGQSARFWISVQAAT
jgi:predicted CopG family antitoxin